MKKRLLVVLLISWPLVLSAQNPFTSLEERMTGKEFTAAGLEKLTDQELDALNSWLRDHSVATLESTRMASAPLADPRGFKNKPKGSDAGKIIQSSIVGTFSGWDGATVFKLANGMVWKQAESDNFKINPVENPAVTIKKGIFRSWHLNVDGYNSKVKVERLQ
jgi:hypothetical protein